MIALRQLLAAAVGLAAWAATATAHLPPRLFGARAAQIEGDGTTRYFHPDGQGSTLALSDADGAVTDQWFYGPYGETLNRTGGTATPYQWVGGAGVRLDAGGLYHMGARHYHASFNRFMSRDPIGLDDGGNLYAYAALNPLLFIDPYGLSPSVWGEITRAADNFTWQMQSWQVQNQAAESRNAASYAQYVQENPGAHQVAQYVHAAVAIGTLVTPLRGVAAAASRGALTAPSSVPLGFTRAELPGGSFLNRVYDSSGVPGRSQLFGGSFSPGSALPTDAASAITARGINPSINNAQAGAVFRANQTITVYEGTSLGGTAPEVFVPQGLHQYLTPVIRDVPIVPGP